MNIFNQELRIGTSILNPGINFVRISLAKLEDKMLKEKRGKRFFVDARSTPEEISLLFSLFTNPDFFSLPHHLVIVFPDSQTEKDFIYGFKSKFRFISAAGGVIFKNGEVFLIERLGKWDLPKGKLDPGETMEECAIREVIEETGLSEVVTREFFQNTHHVYFRKGKWELKLTEWYLMDLNQDQDPVLESEEDITDYKWEKIDPQSLSNLDTYPSIRHLLLKVLQNKWYHGFVNKSR